jgi:F0F1-type ATP synthase assembly protein I
MEPLSIWSGWPDLFPEGTYIDGMKKLASLVGATVGGYAGWYLGALAGTMTAFMVSMVGTGFGMYYGVKIAKRYYDG